MIICAIIDGWKRKVPNRLTYPLIFSGWALGLAHDLNRWFDWGLVIDATSRGEFGGGGGLGASLLGTLVAGALLYPVYAIRGMGAGDVKMQAGFGAWVGAFFGLERSLALWIVFWAFAIGVLVGGVIGVIMMVVNRSWRQNLQNTRAILLSLASGQLATMSKTGQEIRDRGPKLPYGVPLCIGFVGYLWYLSHVAGSQFAGAVAW
jgi:prepilin peptidase CpaA